MDPALRHARPGTADCRKLLPEGKSDHQRTRSLQICGAARALLAAAVLAGAAGTVASAGEKSGQIAPGNPRAMPSLWKSDEARLVNGWWRQGTAAGNTGDTYQNRDGGHSRLQTGKFPQVGSYSGRIMGSQYRLCPGVTVGNSSTVMKRRSSRGGPGSISHGRSFYRSQYSASRIHAQYRANNLYVYPEHRDHGPGRNGRPEHGDLFPANTPYLIVSQGSSGSDRAFLRAVFHTMAAFRPEVKKRLVKENLLMPTVQAVMRSCYKDVARPGDYFTGLAHPTVFDGKKLDPVKMVTAAQRMTLRTVPPLVSLEVAKEDFTKVGGRPEKLFDTSQAIARVHRSREYIKRMTVSAARSASLNNGPLRYRWVVLRGDAKRITIRPGADGSAAELEIPWHGRTSAAGTGIESNRVDIGVFASSGGHWSAPAFVTVFYLDCESRTYGPKGEPLDIYYAVGDTRIGYPIDNPARLVTPAGSKKPYDIIDWPALLAAATGRSRGLGAQLLRKRLRGPGWSAVARAASACKPDMASRINARGKLDKKQRAAQAKACRELGKALLAVDPAARLSARDVLEGALNSIRADHALYPANARAIDALAAACTDRKAKAAYAQAKSRVEELGLFGKGTRPRSKVRPGGELTGYEAYVVELLNLEVMNHLLFPGVLDRRGADRPNFADSRLGTPRQHRDVKLKK